MLNFFKRLPWQWYALTAVLFVLDIASKAWVSSAFQLYEVREITSFFELTLRHNYGAAFSLFADQPGWQRWFLGIVAAVMSVVLLVWLSRLPKDHTWEACALALILSGALGNLYDRVTLGYVVDFIVVYYFPGKPWPAFNVADSAICVGAAILIWDSFKKGKDNQQSAETNKASTKGEPRVTEND